MEGLSMHPRAYFDRQCVVSCDPGDETIPLAIQGLGADKILFATDYPHFDSGGGSVKVFWMWRELTQPTSAAFSMTTPWSFTGWRNYAVAGPSSITARARLLLTQSA